jgi:pimeloyl-ACP methyl ester carboxylesterase
MSSVRQPPSPLCATRLRRREFLVAGTAALGGGAIAANAAVSSRVADCAAPLPLPDAGPTVHAEPAQAAAVQALASLPEVRLSYWDTGGDGEPLVLLHPFTGSSRVWTYQQPAFAQAGYRVIGYSRRGFEDSEIGPQNSPGTGSGDLQALLDHLHVGQFHAVASAGGAFVAADFAASHPERLLSLTLACTVLGVINAELNAMIAALLPPEFNALPAYLRELGPSYRAMDPKGTQRWRELERSSMPVKAFHQPNANELTIESLQKFTQPTLLLCGDADLIAPPTIMRELAKHIPHGELHILPECGHSAYWERPELFNEHVLQFIRRHRSNGRPPASSGPNP